MQFCQPGYNFFCGNLVNDPAASVNDHLGGEHPFDCVTKLHMRIVHSSGAACLMTFSKVLFMGISIMPLERETCERETKLRREATYFLCNS